MAELTDQNDYKELIAYISTTYSHGQQKAMQAANAGLVDTYWQIGRHIVKFEQGGAERAKYGSELYSGSLKTCRYCTEKDLV